MTRPELAALARALLASGGEAPWTTRALAEAIHNAPGAPPDALFKQLMGMAASGEMVDCVTRGDPRQARAYGRDVVTRPWVWHAPKPIEHCPSCGQLIPTADAASA